MKTYTFTPDRETLVPSTPTIVAFVQSAWSLNKEGETIFSGLRVMKHAIEAGIWTTRQTTDKQLMTTWAFYLKDLKKIGFNEHGSIAHNGKRLLEMSEIIEELEPTEE